MESTSFPAQPPHARNDKLKDRNKEIDHDSLFLNHGYSSGRNNNNSACTKQPLEYTKPKERFSYDTLDSAYDTSESSYNTVDSSYSQRSKSSGYGTLDLEWKSIPSSFEFKKSKESYKQDVPFVKAPVSESFDASRAFQLSDLEAEQLKYVDDLEDSDTATETETDTEFTIASSTFDPDMSYVPYYIRPIVAPVSVRAMTTTTSSFITSRPILTSTRTSPSVSVTSSTMTSPADSVIDEDIALSPKATNYKRSDKRTSYAGYREDYVLKQKEKLCGRRSLDERLKSLEAGAAVKLQVCQGSKNRKRRSGGREMISTIRSIDPTVKLYSRPRSPVREAEESHTKQDFQLELTEAHHLDPPESNQQSIVQPLSPSGSECSFASKNSLPALVQSAEVDMSSQAETDLSSQAETDVSSQAPVSFQPQEDIDLNNGVESEGVESEPSVEGAEADARAHSISTEEDISIPSIASGDNQKQEPQPEPEAVEPIVSSNNAEAYAQNDATSTLSVTASNETPFSPASIEILVPKLTCTEPSEESTNLPSEPFEMAKIPPPLGPVQALSSEQSDVKSNEGAPVVMRREGHIQRRGAPSSLVVDVATGDTVVPVELRSPRNEPGGYGRVHMREKRNARMFVLPSSDDSETDNIFAKLTRSIDSRPAHVAPVKFVPSVLRRAQSRSSRDDGSESSSSSSLVADVKACCIPQNTTNLAASGEENKPTTLNLPKEQRRKSSRSPNRTNSKKPNRSKSSHDRPKAEKKKRPRTLSSGSRPVAPDASSLGDQRDALQELSTQAGIGRLELKSGLDASANRHRLEYSELPNAIRKSPLDQDDFPEVDNIPSPRQQVVADVVKFGFSGNEAAIPYIDDNCGSEGRKNADSVTSTKEPSPSGDLLQHADSFTIKKALPLGPRGRSNKRKEGPRRTSYMEAMESSDDLTPDSDTDGSGCGVDPVDCDREPCIALGKYGRSNSADSILSTTDVPTDVVLRKRPRASSADRNSLKGVHRRSYQIATTTPVDNTALIRPSQHKRQASIKKLKNFFAENAQQTVEGQVEDARRGGRGRSIGPPPPSLLLNERDDTIVKEGFLYFKVATIEKGKRTSSQKSWKLVWVVLKEQLLYLCKDWNRNKLDSSPGTPLSNNSPRSMPGHAPSHLLLEEEDPLNIQGSLVSIAYNYVKRKNVFKVTTCNGSEYLLQAEDRDDMLTWINSIHVRGNHDNEEGEVTINEDLILRKTSQIESGPKTDKRGARKSRSPKAVRKVPAVPVKDVDGPRKFRWKGSVNRIVRKFGQGQTLMQGGTFGVHLEDCPPSVNNEFVPFVVDLCCRIVEERGLSFTGIYRVPGNSGTLASLEEELNSRGADAVDLENDPRFCDLNVVSSLLKSFFRNLPDPLFTNELYDDFILMNRNKDPDLRLKGLRRLIRILPPPHYETMKFLMTHLRKIADNSSVNKMEVRNLAIVFGPTLVRSTISDNMATMVTDMSDQCRIIESLLKHAAWFFCDELAQEPEVENSPALSEEHHEPVPNIDHLLANVGRTPGDASDTASESSKSKASCASEKESFSRDVMDMIFGAGKKWMPNSQQRDARNVEEESSDDEFGFKEAKRKQDKPVVEPLTTSSSTTITAPSKSQIAKPATTSVKSDWPNKGQHLPHDIPERLYDFYVESLERLARTDISRPLPYFSSSSTETSPHVTPRSSWLGVPRLPPHRNISYQSHRSSEVKLNNGGTHEKSSPPCQVSAQPSSHQASTPQSCSNVPLSISTAAQKADKFCPLAPSSTPLQSCQQNNKPKHVQINDNQPSMSLTDKNSNVGNEESDSDTSIYIGDTLEEKLRNLTNLDKKLERRPSRRHTNLNYDVLLEITPKPTTPLKPVNKKLTTAPSLKAGELVTPDNFHMYPSKKTTKELYQERKARKQQQNDGKKSIRSGCVDDVMERCASDENVFKRFEPKRQPLRSGLRDDASVSRRSRQSNEKVKRRHTLGGNDFPAQHFWDQSHHASLQNIYRDVPWSAMAHLRHNFGASAPSVNVKTLPTTRVINRGNSFRSEFGRKSESYI